MDSNNMAESFIDEINDRLWSGRFGHSKSIEKQAISNLEEAVKAKYDRGIAYANLNIAVLNFFNSKNESALRYLSESQKWFKDYKYEKGYVRAILLEGNICESLGDYETTLALWLESYRVSMEINDNESEGEACNQLGLLYTRLGNYRKALEYFNKALKIREEMNDENAVASSLNRIGMVLRQTKKYNESLDFYFRSLEIRKKNNQYSAVPWTLLGIASTYEDSGKYDDALSYFSQGYVMGDPRCILQCYMGAGRIYSLKGDNAQAEQMLEKSLATAKDLKALSLIAEAYSALAIHFESIGQSKRALENFKLYHKTRESLLSEEAQSRLRNVEVSYAIKKSEQEKEIFRLKNVELKKAYEIIEEKNKDITASINYASRIQTAILPKISDIKGLNTEIFILFIPKDIISGDFYWFTELKGKLVLAAGDCTGHGVPGALMSMLGISFLEEIVNKRKIEKPGKILDELSKEITRSLGQKGEYGETRDGMDISVSMIDRKCNLIRYSGANNNLYILRDSQLMEYKADRMSIGYRDEKNTSFTEHEIISFPGDMLYMFSDGYADQFGGPNNKKFKYSTLKEMLVKIHKLSVRDQKLYLERQFHLWKGENMQVDDILILGFRL